MGDTAASVCGGAEWSEWFSLGSLPEVTPKIMPHCFPLGLRLALLVVIPASRMGFFITDCSLTDTKVLWLFTLLNCILIKIFQRIITFFPLFNFFALWRDPGQVILSALLLGKQRQGNGSSASQPCALTTRANCVFLPFVKTNAEFLKIFYFS